jgi:hypothetical protein
MNALDHNLSCPFKNLDQISPAFMVYAVGKMCAERNLI